MVEIVSAGRTSAGAIRNWVRRADRDDCKRQDGLTTEERGELSLPRGVLDAWEPRRGWVGDGNSIHGRSSCWAALDRAIAQCVPGDFSAGSPAREIAGERALWIQVF